jgi:iron complex outermembrane receptor protein
MKPTRIAQAVALLGLIGPVFAQTPTPVPKPSAKLEKVTITGSSIKRLADERALPIETITRADIERRGLTGADELVEMLSSNVAGANNPTSTNTVFGPDADRLTGGSSFANLRGLGPTGTLVLLNGRRVSTAGMSGGAVDLNAIPMEAVERVEVLKDGASAIYGTDAIGGVINFITRTDYQGMGVRASYSTPEASGGGQRARVSATGGVGSLAADGWNLMGSVTFDDNKILRGRDRDWASGFQPERFLTPDSSSSQHANIRTVAGTALTTGGSVVGATDPTRYTILNLLAIQNRCQEMEYQVPMAPNMQIWNRTYPAASSRYACTRDYGRNFMLSSPKEATNLLLKGSFAVTENHTAAVEVIASRTETDGEYSPFQFNSDVNPRANLKPTSPHYNDLRALVGATQFNPTLPVAYRLNMLDWGLRNNIYRSDNLRAQVTLDGTIGAYDYSLGVGYGSAEGSTLLKQGYAMTGKLVDLLESGRYNPFLMPGETQSADVVADIEAMQARGRIQGGKTSVKTADATVSGSIGKFLAGEVLFAVGASFRQETYQFSGTQSFSCVSSFTVANIALPNSVMGCPGNSSAPALSRDIGAVFGELIVKPLDSLELTLQVRHDQYQKVGGTTNPKLGLKFQPTAELLLRASANTGFRAPTPQQLQLGRTGPQDLTSRFRDPVLCANAANPTDATQCDVIGLDFFSGGNPNLKPEKSKQATAGIVFQPMRNLQLFADYWQVQLDGRIRTIGVTTQIANYDLFSQNFVRDPATNRVLYVEAGWVNAAESRTKGLDFGAKHQAELLGGRLSTSLSGTKMLSNKERLTAAAPLVEFVGKWNTTNLYLPWRLDASVGYAKGPWNVTLSGIYRDSYEDENRGPSALGGNNYLTPDSPLPFTRTIDSYATFNLVGTWTGIKGLAITGGIINLFDKQPPFTWHNVDNVIGAGWDPRVADPRGRTYSLSMRYAF